MAEEETTNTEKLSALRGRYDAIEYLDSEGKLKKSRGTGDAVALAMLGMSEDEVRKTAEDNELEISNKPNFGLYRLAVGNSLRAKIAQGESVVIGSFTVKKLDQKINNPAIKAAADFRKQREKEAAAAAKEKAKEEAAKAKAAKAA